MDLASSTVITPSLPTLSMASAISLPIRVVVGGDGGDLAISSLSLTFLECLLELLDGGLDGLVDAALEDIGLGRR